MPKVRTRKSSGPSGLPYNALVPNQVETLFPLPQSATLADAALKELNTLLITQALGLSAATIGEDVVEKVRHTASRYFIGRSNYDEDRLNEVRSLAASLAKNAAALTKGIESPTISTAILHQARYENVTLDLISTNLKVIARACAKVKALQAKKGPASQLHIRRAVFAYANLWVQFSGIKFGKNWESDRHAAGRYFKGPGPEFVLRIMQAMDPAISREKVTTAIKHIKVGKLNPPSPARKARGTMVIPSTT